MATITFDQTGLSPAGITNRSRSDGLINGSEVTITVDQSGTVTFVDVPEGDVTSASSLTKTGTLTWKFTPTVGIYGSWLVEFQPAASNTKPVRRVFAVRTPAKGLRIPAFNEHASSLATVADGASFVDQSDDNEGGTYRGWARSLAELFRTVANGLFTANKVQESGGPATLNVSTIPASGVLRRNSTSQIVGGPVLVDNAGNITGAGTYNAVAVTAHAARHQDGGADEISVTGLSGLLADPQTAGGLKTATTTVALSTAAAPTAGQVLTASSSTAAAWAPPPSAPLSNAVPVQLGPNTVGAAGVSTNAARDDHAHGMPGLATTSIDGFMPATSALKLAGIATGADVTLTALSTAAVDIAVNSRKITGLGDPTNAQDAATKGYADAVTQGLDVKQSCRVIATTNITLSGTQTIDGAAVVVGDRVLCAGQTTGANNGIWVVAAGAWTRAADADVSAEVTSGLFAFIVDGTVNADSGWVLTTLDPITLGTTPLVFAQFSGAGQVQAGAGLTKVGNTLNVVGNGDGSIVVAADDVKVGVLATDAQHGTRGGGTLHATAVAGGAAGFISGADQTKLNNAVAGPASSVNGNFASFNGTDGKLLQSSSVNATTLVTGPASAVANNFPSFNGTSGRALQDSGISATTLANVVSGPPSAGDGNVASYNFTSGKLLQDGGIKANTITTGPASAVANNLVSFSDTGGKILKDSGASASTLAGLVPGQSASVGRLTVDTILEVPTTISWTSLGITLDAAVKNDYVITAITGTTNITWSNPAAGRQGTLAVRMDGVGGRQLTLSAPATWTLMRDSASTDLAPSPAANAITVFTWSFITVGGANILLVGKIIAV